MRTSVFAALLATAMIAQIAPASATVCTYDRTIGGSDALRDYSLNINPNGPQTVTFQYFGAITEVQLYAGGLLYYRGGPINSFNAPGPFSLIVLKGNPGDVVKVTTDWASPPPGCR